MVIRGQGKSKPIRASTVHHVRQASGGAQLAPRGGASSSLSVTYDVAAWELLSYIRRLERRIPFSRHQPSDHGTFSASRGLSLRLPFA